jgi:hypothetical protein
MPRANRFVELLGNFLGCLRWQAPMPFAVPPAHRRLTEPVILSVYSAPVPLADVVPQVRRGTGQPFKLLGALDMEFASEVHVLRLIFNVLLYNRLAYFAGRRNEVAPRPERILAPNSHSHCVRPDYRTLGLTELQNRKGSLTFPTNQR